MTNILKRRTQRVKRLKKSIEIEVEWDIRLWIELMYLRLETNEYLLTFRNLASYIWDGHKITL